MKRLVLLTVLMGLFFVGLTSVFAVQHYVRWSPKPTYDCVGTPGDRTLKVHLTSLAYDITANGRTVESVVVDNSYGHSAYVYETLDPQWTTGTHKHYTYTIDSDSYPITLKETITTKVGGVAVYKSTFVAKCTANAQGLTATVNNNDNP